MAYKSKYNLSCDGKTYARGQVIDKLDPSLDPADFEEVADEPKAEAAPEKPAEETAAAETAEAPKEAEDRPARKGRR